MTGASPSLQLEITKNWKNLTGDLGTGGMYQYVPDIYVPTNESPADGYPVMICLHGNGATGSVINNAPYNLLTDHIRVCLLYTSPSPRDQRGSRMAGWG